MRSLAKTTRPDPSRIARRRRLFRLLDSHRRCPILWIAGPAGCGKTSLVSSYVDARGLVPVWYQMDAGDADPATFFCYMGMAAQQAAPRRRRPMPLLTPEYLHDVPTFALRYFEGLFGRLGRSPVVVIDNYQDVATEASLHAILRKGFAAIPEGARVIVLSRHMPPAAFARFRTHGQMQVISWGDLRLTLDEARALVRARGGRRLPQAEIRRAHAAADGWAAGLIMILNGAGATAVESRAAGPVSCEETFDYFSSELFDQADLETQRFLLETALLPTMTVRMAQELGGLGHAGEVLARLTGSHFFTSCDVKREPVYQYHPLFREFLLARGRRTWTADEATQLRERAAKVLEGQGQPEEALALVRESASWERLAQLIVQHAPATVAQGRHRTVEGWIRELPADAISGNAWLLYWLGMCLLPQDVVESRRSLERAFALFDRQADVTGRLLAWGAIVESHFYGMDETASLDPWIDWLDQHIAPSFEYPSAEVEAVVTTSMAGALVQRQPQHPHIEHWMDRAFKILHSSIDVQLRLRAGTFVAQHDVWRGELGRLARVAEEIQRISRLPNASPLSLILWHWCESFAVCNAIEGSVARGLCAIEAGLALARSTGVHAFDPMLLAQGALSSLAAGDLAGVHAYLARMEACPQGKNTRALRHYLAIWVSLDARDARAALTHAQESLRLAVGVGSPTAVALSRLALADALGAAGRTREARAEIAQARAQAEASGYAHLASDCDLVEAHLLLVAGDPDARPAIARAMATVRSRNFLSAYFCAPAFLARLCLEALEAGIEVDYLQRLVRVRRLRVEPPPSHCAAWPWEVRILTLGRFEIFVDGRGLTFKGKAPVRLLTLLKALVAFGPGGGSEAQLADLLWPDSDGDAAHQALTTSLHRLRQLLGNERAVQLREGQVRLDPCHCWVDAHAFENLVERAERPSGTGVASDPMADRGAEETHRSLERALTLYQGAFLCEAPERWLASYRERLKSKFLRVVQKLGERHEREQQPDHAVQWYLRGLEADESAESLYRRIIRCYGLTGRRAEAVAIYERCRRVLWSSLGVEPSPETETLVATLLQGPREAAVPPAILH